jgi:hypothetical protein
MKAVLIAAMSLLMVAGCASDVANRYYGATTYPAKPVSEVEVFLATEPTRNYTAIADFQSRNETPRDLQKKAAKIGADAVIVTLVGGYASKSVDWAGDDPYSTSHSHILGTAIIYE